MKKTADAAKKQTRSTRRPTIGKITVRDLNSKAGKDVKGGLLRHPWQTGKC